MQCLQKVKTLNVACFYAFKVKDDLMKLQKKYKGKFYENLTLRPFTTLVHVFLFPISIFGIALQYTRQPIVFHCNPELHFAANQLGKSLGWCIEAEVQYCPTWSFSKPSGQPICQ